MIERTVAISAVFRCRAARHATPGRLLFHGAVGGRVSVCSTGKNADETGASGERANGTAGESKQNGGRGGIEIIRKKWASVLRLKISIIKHTRGKRRSERGGEEKVEPPLVVWFSVLHISRSNPTGEPSSYASERAIGERLFHVARQMRVLC